MADCNAAGINLNLDPSCRADRLTREYTPVCRAQLGLISTHRACPNFPRTPKTISIDLKEANVTHEAQYLVLTVGAKELKVGINK
jgi:hypothetical protein